MIPMIGVLGGLGPQTTSEFYLRLVQLGTKLARPSICIWSLPLNLGMEQEYIRSGKHSSYYRTLLRTGARGLHKAGSSFVVIPCNTVHEFHPNVERCVDIPVVNLIQVVADEVSNRGWEKIFLLATSRTIKTQLYQKTLSVRGVEVVTPDRKQQARLDMLIQGLLGNRTGKTQQRFLENMIERSGASHLILGCTDLQLVFAGSRNCVDSMEALARHTASLI